MRMDILKAREEHVPGISMLEETCFSEPWPMDMIGRLLDQFTVAMEGDLIVGYAALSTVLDEGNLDSIAVLPEYRRKGVAEALLDEILRQAKEQELAFVTLEVREGNAAAIALYSKKGFREVGRRKNYYEKPREDAILMTLVFDNADTIC